jgi:PII-like signaling protein
MAKIELKRINKTETGVLNYEPQVVIPDEILTKEELKKNRINSLEQSNENKLQKQDILKMLASGATLLTTVIGCYKDIALQKEKTKIERLNAEAKIADAKEKTKQIIMQETELTKREIKKYEELEKSKLLEIEKYKTELQIKNDSETEDRKILVNVLNMLLKSFDSLLSEKALILQKINGDDLLFERYKTRLNEIDATITKSQQDIIQLITKK